MKNIAPPFTISLGQSILCMLLFLSLNSAIAQIKIGDNPQNIDTASLLELESADKALVLSRITTGQMQEIRPLQGAVVYNIDERCVFYYDGSNWINLCRDGNGFSIIDNGNNTYTVNDGNNSEFTFATNTETITNIVQNSDGTFTYTNEAGEEIIIANGSGAGENSLSITDNGNNTYTVNDGSNPEFIITTTPETVTDIAQNADGIYIYTNEAGDETIIPSSDLTITDNGNNTYTVSDGDKPEFTITATPETITSITQNDNGTYTYTNEADEEVIISFSGSGEEGSVFFADADNGIAENNAQIFWDNATERLGIGTNLNLADKLTVNGTLGISDGSALLPSYRFSGDADTGIYRSSDDELSFSVGGNQKMKLSTNSLFLNNALPIDPSLTDMPVLIRANEGELFGFQRSDGNLKWILSMREQNLPVGVQGGIGFVELGVSGTPTLFLENAKNLAGPDYGRVGINTKNPQTALHVVGEMRVTILPPAQPSDTFVTVDANGNFHKAASAQPVVTGGGRWTNSSEPLFLSGGLAIIPIFDDEDYNDGTTEFYEPNSNTLTIKSDGRYDIGATISLKGNLTDSGDPANTWARISINGIDIGAFNVAANSGSTNANAFSSIHISEVLNLQAGDTIRIKLFSNANPSSLLFAEPETSSFTIKRQ